MDKPIKGYGGIGWILTSVFIFGAALVIEPLAAQALLALFGLGTLIWGVRTLKEGLAGS
ncbi:hypothetical protein [Halorientalis marina]|uniref:hypothetical protein n=1 Tax=Halorientalis marina TaxID=2931976 RepID=UPI001FF41FD0|nr:hypothetical protein [Halorientalis marina]